MSTTYSGSCHCGFIQFRVIATIDHVRECNCSICFRRGALNIRVEHEALEVITPLEFLNTYQWGSYTATDFFCPTCGILPFRKPAALTDNEIKAGCIPFTGWAVNARCLTGIDLNSVPIKKIDGKSL